MSITLHGAAYSVYVRIARLALIEKGVAHDLDEVDIFAAGGAPQTHLARHPFGRIPALAHDGFVLYETAAITRYVDEAFDGPALQPATPRQRARMAQAIGLLDAYGYRALVWDLYVEAAGDRAREGATDPAVVARGLDRGAIVLGELDRFLADEPYLAGDRLSLADLHAAPMLAYAMAAPQGLELVERHAHVSAWLGTLRRRTSVVSTRPAEAAW